MMPFQEETQKKIKSLNRNKPGPEPNSKDLAHNSATEFVHQFSNDLDPRRPINHHQENKVPLEEKINTAEERIKELQRLIEHWKKQQ